MPCSRGWALQLHEPYINASEDHTSPQAERANISSGKMEPFYHKADSKRNTELQKIAHSMT